MNLAPSLLLAVATLTQAPDAPPGRRVDLAGEATVFVPASIGPDDPGPVDLLIHLHGAPSAVEPALSRYPRPAVLLMFNRPGLSRAYTEPFRDPTLFPRLVDGATRALRDGSTRPEQPPRPVGRIVVSAFSAGFGGVRELLKVPDHVRRIDALVLADSLYCGYQGDPSGRVLAPDLMAGFRRFAAEAEAGRKAMVVSHSAQVPAGYGSTTETADDLLRAVGGAATAERVDRGGGWVETRSFARGNLRVLGFAGTEGEDHLRHLRRIGDLWALIPGSPPAPAATSAASPAPAGTAPPPPATPR